MRWLTVALSLTMGLFGGLLIHIHRAARREQRILASRDVVIVLGTAVSGDEPSPVFETRIQHGLRLHDLGRVHTILFTGGLGSHAQLAESEVAARYAQKQGISAEALLVETHSTNTFENLREAARLMHKRGLQSAYIVSDPLHLQRAMRMADDLGLDAAPAPTPFAPHNNLFGYAFYLVYEGVCTLAYWIERETGWLDSAEARPAISHSLHSLNHRKAA